MSPLADLYYQHWQADRSAGGLERFLSQRQGLDVTQLVGVLLVDQALEWQSGFRPSVEQYIERFPAIAHLPAAVLELIYGEMRAQRGRGLPVEVDSYVARFPDFAEPLRRQIEVATWTEDRDDSPREQS